MSEQTGAPDSQPSIEDRVASALFGPDSPEDEQQPEPEFNEGDDDDEQPEAQDAAPPEGSTDIEIEGRNYTRDELKAAILRREDHTRKTQEIAERGRLLDAHEQMIAQRAAFEEQTTTEREQLRTLESQLAQFKQLDWSTLDMESTVRYSRMRDDIRDQINEAKQSLNSKYQDFTRQAESKHREVLEQGQKYLQTTVPGWNAERAKKVAEQALSEGFTQHQLAAIDSMANPMAPLIVKLVNSLVVPPVNWIRPMAVLVRPANLLEPVTVSVPVPP